MLCWRKEIVDLKLAAINCIRRSEPYAFVSDDRKKLNFIACKICRTRLNVLSHFHTLQLIVLVYLLFKTLHFTCTLYNVPISLAGLLISLWDQNSGFDFCFHSNLSDVMLTYLVSSFSMLFLMYVLFFYLERNISLSLTSLHAFFSYDPYSKNVTQSFDSHIHRLSSIVFRYFIFCSLL